jgi:hypothetical protein
MSVRTRIAAAAVAAVPADVGLLATAGPRLANQPRCGFGIRQKTVTRGNTWLRESFR